LHLDLPYITSLLIYAGLHLFIAQEVKMEAKIMDIWLEEWLDCESERLRANEAREVRRRRTLANWQAMRLWQGWK